jgi:mediator of RNA polymerase II transcription subunit 6
MAAALPDFTPSLGHTYLPPLSTSHSKPSESQFSQVSKENTPLPESLNNQKKNLPSSTSSSTYLSSRLFEESLNISLKYGDEYMDENPITGQPGDFHLSTTGRKERDKLMVPLPGKESTQAVSNSTGPPSLSVKTESPISRKGSKGEKSPRTTGVPKPKRRKSKALASGGVSPA